MKKRRTKPAPRNVYVDLDEFISTVSDAALCDLLDVGPNELRNQLGRALPIGDFSVAVDVIRDLVHREAASRWRFEFVIASRRRARELVAAKKRRKRASNGRTPKLSKGQKIRLLKGRSTKAMFEAERDRILKRR